MAPGPYYHLAGRLPISKAKSAGAIELNLIT
jgi:hypothetical protein